VILKADLKMEILLQMNIQHVKRCFKNHWLDIEPIYREAGWIVEYSI
jgi:hypothetical protein